MSAKALKHTAFIICLSLLFSLLPAGMAKGVDPLIITVNTTADGRDFATNSVCSVDAPTGGPCTLRAAISEAKGNVPYQDVIVNVPAGNYLLTIPPDTINDVHSGDLNIIPPLTSSYTITINGTGTDPSVIDANQLDRVFDIGDVHITMRNLVIRGGYLLVTEAFMWGAGINNYGYLTLEHVVIEDNTIDCGPDDCDFVAYGGGIYNANGSLNIIASTIQNNTSPFSSAIYNTSAPVFISYSTIRNNHASYGDTIYNIGATFTIFNSTITGNTSSGTAGITNYGNLMIASSTLANSGISASIDHRYGSVAITDSILSAVPNQEGTSYNCFVWPADLPWTSLGYNIFSDDTCPATGPGDLINTDPMLGELDWWGGPTMTLPLIFTSPAIDHHPGNCWDMYGVAPLVNDQRYFPRDDGQCDTGAFEGYINQVTIFLPFVTR